MKETVSTALKKIKKNARGRATAFVIGNTSDLFLSGRYYETPVRETPELIYGGVIARDVTTARAIAKLADGKVDYVFVDDEKKVRKIYYGGNDVGNIEKTVRGVIKKSTLLTYKGNDLAVEAVDALVCNLMPEVSGTKVAIIGMGNFGSKAALKLVERGVHVSVYRRDQQKLHTISVGLNQIKSKDTISKIIPVKSIVAACKGAEVVIGVTNEKSVIKKAMLKYAAPGVILIDAGKGCFADDVVEDPSFLIYRVDVSIIQKHSFLALIHTHAYMKKGLGRRNIPKLRVILISMGLLARKGEVIVDNIKRPTVVVGVAAGGGVLERNTPQIQKRIIEVKNFFKIK
ncbi:MAG: hypothetical protein G01um101456_70 [Parcubacteria group bacterium Gr01-1014_56]|nr:MAG: hypothetical protein G01um101456_70 [Parcubacteria group bacterium Gr01-1014_56]